MLKNPQHAEKKNPYEIKPRVTKKFRYVKTDLGT